MFEPIPYLEWIEGRPEAATHDLGSSDLRRYRFSEGVVPDPLRDRDDPTDPPGLAASIAAEYGVDADQVLVTAGATHANFLAAATALALADERRGATDSTGDSHVLVEKPGYDPLVHTPRALGANVDRFVRPAAEGYPLVPDRVAGALRESTALVTVSNRHNPTGALSTRGDLADVADAIGDAGAAAPLLVDEVYGPYVERPLDDGEGAFGGVTAAGLPNTVVTGSLTKFHGLGGVRLGWLVGPVDFVERAASVRHHVPAVARPSEALARRFFAHRDELLSASRRHLARNHDLLASFLEARDDLAGRVPDGCSYAYVEHESLSGDELTEAAWDRDILVVPGRFFGLDAGVRLSAGREPDHVESALAALGDLLDNY